MSTTIIPVNDKEQVTIQIINNVEIRVINLSLGNFVDVSATVKHNNNYISNHTFHITGEEYNDWGNDDDYLENLVLQKLDLTRKE
jgi:hypothetical protein